MKKRKRKRSKVGTSEPGDEMPADVHEKSGTEDTNAPPQALPDVTSEPPRKKKKRKVDTSHTALEHGADGAMAPDVPTQKISAIVSDANVTPFEIRNTPTASTQEATTTTVEQKPRKARKKRKEKDQVDEPPPEDQTLPTLPPPIEPKATKRRKTKEAQNPPIVDDSVALILTGKEKLIHCQLSPAKMEAFQTKKLSQHMKNQILRQWCPPREVRILIGFVFKVNNISAQANTQAVDADKSEVSIANREGDSQSVVSKKSRKLKKLTVNEREAAKADMDAILTKALAKRVAAATSVNLAQETKGQDIVELPSKSKQKKKSTVDKELPSSLALANAVVTDPPKSTFTVEVHPVSPSVSTLEPICPLCLLSPLHEREKCPLVLGGPESLAKRLSEIQESSDDGQINRLEIMAELRGLLREAEQKQEKQEKNAQPQLNSHKTLSLRSRNQSSGSTVESTSSKHVLLSSSTKQTTANQGTATVDTSSDESSDDNVTGHVNGLLQVYQDLALLANTNLDDVIRGPGISAVRIADLPSPDSSDEEVEDRIEDQILEEDEPEKPRRSRKSGILDPDSSDDGDSGLDDAPSVVDEPQDVTSTDASTLGGLHLGSGTDHVSFQAVDRIGESQEVDRSADAAFGDALESDIAILIDTVALQGATPSEPAAVTGPLMEPSPIRVDLDSTLDATPPYNTSTPAPPAGPLTTQPFVSTSPTNLRDPSLDRETRDDDKPADAKPVAGIIQRMKTRNGKTPINDKNLYTPASSQTPRTRLAANHDVPDSAARRTRASTRQQTLGTMTPPALPAKLGRQTRLIRPGASQSTEDTNVSSSKSRDEMSLDTWATLKPSSPIPDADATMMVDELEPSSPHDASMYLDDLNKDSPEDTTEDPLFFPMESLPPFPYSQWNGESQKESENDPDKSNDQNEAQEPVQSQPKPKPSQNPRYRRLTDITIDHGLFSTPTTTLRATRSSIAAKKADMYGRSGKDDIESETDSESDNSDVQETSHIPKSRRAGVKPTRRK
ncbi:hypothetical protein C0991_001642 [Blastosporella zonata]|nr:hypothetical protein C0991_001642 [Blastosporella zonata]